MIASIIIKNITGLYTMDINQPSFISNAYLAIQYETILEIGQGSFHHLIGKKTEIIDARGCIITPGFIDVNTNIGFNPYAFDYQGKPIVNSTSEFFICQKIKKALDDMLSHGVTTLHTLGDATSFDEMCAHVLRLKKLNRMQPIDIYTTFSCRNVPKEMYKKSNLFHMLINRRYFHYIDINPEKNGKLLKECKKRGIKVLESSGYVSTQYSKTFLNSNLWETLKRDKSYQDLTSYELLKLVTIQQAKYLQKDKIGVLKTGFFADFIIFYGSNIDEIRYQIGKSNIHSVYKRGIRVVDFHRPK